jgi:hypothetical protein
MGIEENVDYTVPDRQCKIAAASWKPGSHIVKESP